VNALHFLPTSKRETMSCDDSRRASEFHDVVGRAARVPLTPSDPILYGMYRIGREPMSRTAVTRRGF